jgi:hypothetical protein
VSRPARVAAGWSPVLADVDNGVGGYDQYVADVFRMDPQPAQSGLAATAGARSSGLAAGIPALPVGNYLSGFSTEVGAVLATLYAEETGLVEQGSVTSALGATVVETTELGQNVPTLTV